MNKIKLILKFIFLKSPVYKMIVSFIIFLLSIIISVYTDTMLPIYIGLPFLGFFLMLLII